MSSPINWPKAFHYVCANFNTMPMKWWFCFGTLLHTTRAVTGEYVFKTPPEKYWKGVNDDIDIGVFYDEYEPIYIKNFCSATGWEVSKHIRPDTGGKPFYLSLKPKPDIASQTGPVHIDIFAWYRHKGMLWHTYDTAMENPKKGIPKKYVFKGAPEWVFNELVSVDNMGGSRIGAKLPLWYGHLFDWWYDDWIRPHPQAVSHPRWCIEMESCKSFEKENYKVVSWPDR